MGIVNVTPDSFSDGGQFLETGRAVEHGLKLIDEGADILDVGGESTRPGADDVPAAEELRRVVPVIATLARTCRVPISVDTRKAAVARAAVDAGAAIVNDVTGLAGDADMAAVVRESGAGAIVMHMQGEPRTMQLDPKYTDVVAEVRSYFAERMERLTAAGIDVEALALDPGIGFGKTQQHNLVLLKHLSEFRGLGRPICLGISRKGILGLLTGRPRSERVIAGVAAACHGIVTGSVQLVRTHDVAATRDAILVMEGIRRCGEAASAIANG